MNRERVTPEQRAETISQASFGRLMGKFKPDGVTMCDAFTFGEQGEKIPCGELAICRVGNATGHPSCEKHAQGVPYVCSLD